jgi:RimJ/RimL family protein N-acetyltransferase
VRIGATGKDAVALRRLAHTLPDLPRWIEARAALFTGDAAVLVEADMPEPALVVLDTATGLVVVIGEPPDLAIREAAHCSAENFPRWATVIAPHDQKPRLQTILPEWDASRAMLHCLPDFAMLPSVPRDRVRLIDAHELSDAEIPETLRDELLIGVSRSPVAATFVDERPVAFCYASGITESLWDISIDTLAEFRRQGYAGWAAAFMIEHMRAREKSAVWGAVEDNVASMALARKLGFVPCDELVLLEP